MGSSEIQISKRSQEFINKYTKSFGSCSNPFKLQESSIELDVLVHWLKTDIQPLNNSVKATKELEFLLALLRAELLHDLYASMQSRTIFRKKEEGPVNPVSKFKYIMLVISGTLLAACEGFDSLTTMLVVLSLPSWAILLAGLGFSILSAVVYYGFNLVQISKNLGVYVADAPQLLDTYLLQLNEIKSIRRTINTYNLARLSPNELEQLSNIIAMLDFSLQSLTKTGKQFELALNGTAIVTAKIFFSSLAGLLFFGSGFFAGQSVALFILGLFLTTVSPPAVPVILFSLLIGASAFCLYWCIERVGLKKLISGWFGLDEDKIETLCDSGKLSIEQEKLQILKDKVCSTASLSLKLLRLEKEPGNSKVDEGIIAQEKQANNSPKTTLYSFFTATCDSARLVPDRYQTEPLHIFHGQ